MRTKHTHTCTVVTLAQLERRPQPAVDRTPACRGLLPNADLHGFARTLFLPF